MVHFTFLSPHCRKFASRVLCSRTSNPHSSAREFPRSCLFEFLRISSAKCICSNTKTMLLFEPAFIMDSVVKKRFFRTWNAATPSPPSSGIVNVAFKLKGCFEGLHPGIHFENLPDPLAHLVLRHNDFLSVVNCGSVHPHRVVSLHKLEQVMDLGSGSTSGPAGFGYRDGRTMQFADPRASVDAGLPAPEGPGGWGSGSSVKRARRLGSGIA